MTLLNRPRNGCDAPLLERTTSVSLWGRLTAGMRRWWERPDWQGFAGEDWAERIMAAEMTDDFHAKQGRSTGRWELNREGRSLSVYLKRHYRLPWWRGVMATLFPRGRWSPGLQEFRHLSWAHEQGLQVPKIVAAGEFLRSWGRLQSFLAIEELTGMIGLHQAIPLASRQLDPTTFARWKAGLARELARLSRFLHDRRHFHKDLYLCHFYVPRADAGSLPAWTGRVHMIDFHRLGHHPLSWRWWQAKDLGQLLYSSHVDGVTARDRLRFWRHYLGGPRRSAPLLTWLVRLRDWRYRDHSAKREKPSKAA